MDTWIALFVSMLLVACVVAVVRLRTRCRAVPVDEPPTPVNGLDPLDDSRYVSIDEEELIEGNWKFFLPDLQRLLAAEGATFAPELGYTDNGFTVSLDGVQVLCVGVTTAIEEVEGVSVQLARVVNRRLEAAGSPKRLYYVGGWNELGGTLLTLDEHSTLRAHGWDEIWDADDIRAPGEPIDPQRATEGTTTTRSFNE